MLIAIDILFRAEKGTFFSIKAANVTYARGGLDDFKVLKTESTF